jgi:prolyl-tRNA synthetase
MRAREFIMKDGYSFHVDHADLEREYRNMYDTYTRIFTRLGLAFRAVAADTGSIGGTGSHEFQVLADSGEDAIAYCPGSDYAANVELAEALAPAAPRAAASETMNKVPTPGRKTCEEVTAMLALPLAHSVKALMLEHEGKVYMLLVRGDHSLNEIKTAKIPELNPFRFATETEIVAATGCAPGYIGPVGMKNVTVIADRAVAAMSDFVCGANEEGFHLTGVNWGRDLPEPAMVADIRNVVAGDPSPDGKGKLEICRGIEVGQIFQLRTVYSIPMNATVLDEAGAARPMEMGCYGIGVTRIVGAAIEQGHDARGIIFPAAIAPFQLAIVPIGMHKNAEVKKAAEDLYAAARTAGIDVLLDDREERPGVMFAEMELMGIPHRIVVGDRGLKEGKLEYQGRRDEVATAVSAAGAIEFIAGKLCG